MPTGYLTWVSRDLIFFIFILGSSTGLRNFPKALPAGADYPIYYVDITPTGVSTSADEYNTVKFDRFRWVVLFLMKTNFCIDLSLKQLADCYMYISLSVIWLLSWFDKKNQINIMVFKRRDTLGSRNSRQIETAIYFVQRAYTPLIRERPLTSAGGGTKNSGKIYPV